MAELAPVLKHKFTDSNDNPLVGGKLYSYVAGTTTPLATYSDVSGTPNTNPIILDANGECDLWISAGSSYKFVLTDSADVPQYTVDNIRGSAAAANSGFESLEVDNIQIDGNTISSTNENGNIVLAPHGTGKVRLNSATASTVPYFDANKDLVSSSVTPTQLEYINTLTGNVQTALDAKATASALSAHESDTTGIHGITDTSAMATKTGTEQLTNKDYDGGTASNTSRITIPKASKATLDGLTRKQGTVVYASDEDKLYYDDGTTLTEIGSGASGSGGINYILNPDATTNTDGWTTYADAAAATPVNGTGGSANVTFTRTTSALRGTHSFILTVDAANRQGEGASYDFTVDNVDKNSGRTLIVSFDYSTGGFYASNDVRVFAYDVTNGTLLNVLNGDSGNILYSNTGSRFVGSFQPVSTSNAYRLIFHCASTNASGYEVYFDNIRVTPEQTVPGAIQWGPITETWTDDWANATTSVTLYRVGPKVFALGKTSMSGAGSTNLNITIPAAYTPSSIYVLGANNLINVSLGVNLFDTSAPTNIPGTITLFGANNLRIFSTNTGAYGGLTSTAPFTWASGDYIEWNASWEVSGWQASAALSTTETMLMGAFAAYTGDAASASSGNPIIVPTKRWDVLNNYNAANGLFTAPRTKKYKIYGSGASANTAGIAIRAYVNSTNTAGLGYTDSNGEFTFAGAVEANAGDTISIRPDNTLDAQSISLYIEEWQDPTVFSVHDATDVIESSVTQAAWAPASNVWGDLTSIQLPPGEYDIFFDFTGATGTSACSLNIGIGTVSGNNAPGSGVVGKDVGRISASGSFDIGRSWSKPEVVVTTTTTYYAKVMFNTNTNNAAGGRIWARKVK